MSSMIPGANIEQSLNLAIEALGINQHHDAVTGTAKQHVSNDYYRILSDAVQAEEEIFKAAAK
jgi:lysosomal alpha-mannosidase